MRKTAAPHRLCIRLADRSAVSGRQRGRDCSSPTVKLGLNMGREPVAEGWRAIRSGEDKANRLQCPAGRTDFVKPRTPRKIIGAGHRCGGRRHQPAAKGNETADRQSLWHIFLSDIDPYDGGRPAEHTSELQSLMRNSYADFCL